MPSSILLASPSLRDFVFRDPSNRRYCIVAAAAALLQLVVFKCFYPFANFFYTDSFAYLYAAVSNQDANIWPVGYSKFIRIFNTFFHSDTSLVTLQYFFLQSAALYLWFTIKYIFQPSRTIANILFIFYIFQPVTLYIANSVSSDALFIGLCLCWIAVLIKMMYHPEKRSVVVHAVLLIALFAIRYNAIAWPFVAAAAIMLSRYPVRQKVVAILLPFAGIALFIFYTTITTRQMTGTSQFAPFGGWQLANNALYMYGHLQQEPPVPVPARFARLDSTVRHFFRTDKEGHTLFIPPYPGIYYLWSMQSPLVQYMGQERKKDSGVAYFKTWASVSPLYTDYGAWLIGHHPAAFAKYYCWPNMIRYAFPPLEFMDRYNSGEDTVESVAKYWFRYSSNRVRAKDPVFQSRLLAFYPILHLLINIFFLGMLGLFFTTRGAAKSTPVFTRSVMAIAGLWGANFVFSILASPVVLRYEVFLMLVTLSYSLLLVEYLIRWETCKSSHITRSDEILQEDNRGLRVRPGPALGLHRNG